MTAPDRELMWRNRVYCAEHWGWPPEALPECERIERIRPAWSPFWTPAGYVAHRMTGYGGHDAEVFAETPAELVEAMDAAPLPSWELPYLGPLAYLGL